eukprot:TRINITY_DN54888_c0_g1_i1.p1 TRINITY_DN54888_c0_g1~~TRINITY_DN54888_c0_g1_i1.p1  ORF type:complete len:153 (+),score=32.74 TRINITY_DN54888_c0_g1_i1:58-516(+)
MADQFTKEQIADFQEAFGLFDKNGDGTIHVDELASVLRSLGQGATPAELRAMMAEVDANSDGHLDFPEFLSLLASRINNDEDREAELDEAFRLYDVNRDGLISPWELRHVMTSLGERMTDEDIQEMMHEADLDGDGYLNFDEFSRMMGYGKR